MKIYEHELIHLLAITRDTLDIANMRCGGLTRTQREKLYNNIIRRQTGVIKTEEKEEIQTD